MARLLKSTAGPPRYAEESRGIRARINYRVVVRTREGRAIELLIPRLRLREWWEERLPVAINMGLYAPDTIIWRRSPGEIYMYICIYTREVSRSLLSPG